ncbi:hypothetical protein MBANPS3_006421 [Mucor bainieri]
MATIASLPEEVLLSVFHSIASVAQLGRCRHVCKRWDDPAELVMFCKPLFVTEKNAMSLYTHLIRKPSRAKLIKRLNLGFCDRNDTISQLLHLALTPSIEEINSYDEFQGMDCKHQDDVFEVIHAAGQKSPEGFPNLRCIPTSYEFTKVYRETLLFFKNSIEFIRIPPDEELEDCSCNELGEFKQLAKLLLQSCFFRDLSHMESVLVQARHLNELEIWSEQMLEKTWSLDKTIEWMKQNVEIDQNVTTIKSRHHFFGAPCLLEYLLFKYPNTKHLATGPCDFPYRNEISAWFHEVDKDGNTEYACRAISKMLSFSVKVVSNANRGRFLDSCTVESQVNQDQKRTTQFQAIVDNNLHKPSVYESHVQLLEEIGRFGTDYQMDFTLAYQDKDEDYDADLKIHQEESEEMQTLESNTFFTALKLAHGLQTMKFVAHSISAIETPEPQPSQRRQLGSLEITGANVHPTTFRSLDNIFHTINNLVIASCCIEKDEQNTINIFMPSTTVRNLLITTKAKSLVDNSRNHFDFMNSKIVLLNDAFVKLTQNDSKTAIFNIKPHCSNALPVALADYTSRPSTTTAFHISCASIGHLELDLGDIQAKVDIDKYMH